MADTGRGNSCPKCGRPGDMVTVEGDVIVYACSWSDDPDWSVPVPASGRTTSCEPYITQDGYDSGQTLCCATHGTNEPVMVDGRQTYEVTLPMLTALVAEHHAKTAPARTISQEGEK